MQEKTREALDVLQSAVHLMGFTKSESEDTGIPLALPTGSDGGSSPFAKFMFYKAESDKDIILLTERLNAITEAGGDIADDLLDALVETREWEEKIRKIYDTSTKLREALEEQKGTKKPTGRVEQTFSAGVKPKQLDNWVGIIDEFRAKAEAYLNIAPVKTLG